MTGRLGLVFWIVVMLERPSTSHAQLPVWWAQIFLQFFLITCCIQLAINFGNIPKTSAIHLRVSQWEWCTFHHRPCWLLSKYNVYGCGQKVKFWSHHSKLLCSRGFEACLCAVWHIVSRLLCGICVVRAYLSLHPEQFSWQLWLKFLSTWPWFGFNRIPNFPLYLNTADWHSQFLECLFISLSCFIQFNYLFPQILWQFFCFPHDSESRKVSAALDERCKGLSGAQKLTNLLYTHWLQANRSQVRMVTFNSHSNRFVSTCVHVIRPKSPGYVNFWSGSFG